MYRAIPWATQSVGGRQQSADGSRLINFYAVPAQGGADSKVPVLLYGAPGLKRYLDTSAGTPGVNGILGIESPIYGNRLVGITDEDKFFAVTFPHTPYLTWKDDNPVVATIPNTALPGLPAPGATTPQGGKIDYTADAISSYAAGEPAKLVTDGRRILWIRPRAVFGVDMGPPNDQGAIPPMSQLTIGAPSPENYAGDLDDEAFVDIVWSQGYFILLAKNGQVYNSNLSSTQFDQLDFAEADALPDAGVGMAVLHRRLYIIGTASVEQWYNAGGADFPFRRDQSFNINIGCLAKHTIRKNEDVVAFLGSDGSVYAISGNSATRISTGTVEYAVAESRDPAASRAFTYTEEGHRFYSLSIPSAEATGWKNWTFDFMTGLWHERTETDILSATRFLGRTLVAKAGQRHVFDMGLDYGIRETDAGYDAIDREAISSRFHAERRRLRVHSIEIDIPHRQGGEAGDEVLLDWSEDSGQNWRPSPARSRPMVDSTGSPLPRPFRWQQLGLIRANGRNFRLRTSAKRSIEVLGSYISYDVGVS